MNAISQQPGIASNAAVRASAAPVRQRSAIAGAMEKLIEFGLLLAALFSVAITAGIVFVLVSEAAPFFRTVPIGEFLTARLWTPLFAEPRYGIMPLLAGTLMTTGIALAVAMPVGTILAIWLSEFAPARVREIVKPVLEMLSAVPTVVFGYFAVMSVTPLLQKIDSDIPAFNMLSAGLVMGVMIVPYISSLSEDAMRSVPMLLREGSYAMGAGRLKTAIRVVFPAALSGIGAAYTLAVARAVGETMIVAIAAGQQPSLTVNPLDSAATITAFIVQVSLGDLPHGTIGYKSIFAAGFTLFVLTLGFNLVGAWLRRRFRQAY
ncbi:MAG: phosphate ABC transporter permease subunit PstC [Phycisphaerales bacterium]|nr:phosphate ABC transporter permease subunit PstC [Phycisphaerales bacterium]